MNIDYDGINSVIDEGINRSEAFLIVAFEEHFGRKPPTHWVICNICRGNGGHSRRLGVVDPEDWDPDEWDEYLAGRYDVACERCNGTGKYLEINESSLTEEQAGWIHDYMTDLYESYEIQRQEMMYGA